MLAGQPLELGAARLEAGDVLRRRERRLTLRQQEARAFDRDGELPLVEGLRSGDAARHDLAGLGDVTLENAEILVVDRLHPFRGEAAELLAAREAATAAA